MSHTIPKETLSFFKKLSNNNNRDWFNEHKPEFKAIEAKVKSAYNHLGELMNAHDQIEKIKTIGDAYMAAGGLNLPRKTKPLDVIHAALEMQQFMKQRRKERKVLGLSYFEMRCGIHTGPVVAGIVGVKKFQYDIWGDTVNVASRMESLGEPGHIHISKNTWALVHDIMPCKPRGKILVKGKGEMETWFIGS